MLNEEDVENEDGEAWQTEGDVDERATSGGIIAVGERRVSREMTDCERNRLVIVSEPTREAACDAGWKPQVRRAVGCRRTPWCRKTETHPKLSM